MFQLDPDLEAFRQEIRKTAERAFAAKAAYWDEKEEFPTENRDMLAKLGYHVAAVTGKPQHHDVLRELGARDILSREDVDDRTDQPLLKGRWAGAVDTVGGNVLGTLLRSTAYRGCVTACGLVAGTDVPLTVYPLLLRGVTLAGIDSAKCPREPRMAIWRLLAGEWRLDNLAPLRREVTLGQTPAAVAEMLAGNAFGRTLVRPTP
ncbi:MAG TPA: zinc-binding dehydrogenase [Lacipirellulaceae bacterium]|nr:zinc-binding dehydrogenase [Lacipirellulaceae bacterium]